MKKIYTGVKPVLFCLLLIPAVLFSASFPLAEKYPVYTYVFSEFDVDEGYIDNEDFERFVRKNEKSIRHLYKRSMQRGEMISPMVKGYLMDQGVSDLFIYLSMVESGFSTDVVSSKKAVGLWQFMPATAQHYKLDVCNSFDERCDPVSATNAAIKYLKKLHEQFGKWYLAAIAYNCGEGRLKRAIKKAGSDELGILTDERDKYLPAETRKYIQKILLAAMIGEGKYIDFGVRPGEGESQPVQVEISGGCDLEKLAGTLGMKPLDLLRMNRQFKHGIVPTKKAVYTLMIPEEKMISFYLKYELKQEPETLPVKPHFVSHVVKMGDTLESIAKKYHSTAEEIRRANRLDDDFLILGSLLLVPVTQKMFDQMLQSL
ncbi:lytic transglycosylase domain-containing protein [Sulfurovum sp.]|uniref:lytic transglycosylase domain-containing protein n=1 Tax=Sulfurovum sp. TaxID=1969726 RepID=UPI002600D64D|nr:lytic transglycosylase domain-containing protein [Sulfurovum sp.]